MADPIKQAKECATLVGEIIKAAGDNPKVKEAGNNLGETAVTLTRTINNVLLPLAAVNYAFDKARKYFEDRFEKDLAGKVAKIPLEEIIEPKASIAGPTLQGLAFTHEEGELKDMFLNLLASAMDARIADAAHPAYVEIIKQLTPAEARLIKFFTELDTYPSIYTYKQQSQVRQGVMHSYSASAREDGEARRGFALKAEKQASKEELLMYLDNFLRLKLLEINTYSSYTPGDRFGGFGSLSNQVVFTVISSGFVAFTAFGKKFIETCVVQKR